MKHTHSKLAIVLASGLLLISSACSNSSKPKKTPATSTTPVTDSSYNNGDYTTNGAGYSGIQISETTTGSDILYVQLNTTSTWTFNATMNNGTGTASITQIYASPQPTGMSISGTTITFRPTTTTELSGTITVSAQGSDGTTEQKSFSWSSGNGVNGTTNTGLMGVLSGILPSLLGGGTTGSTGGIGSILTSLLGGLTTNN